MFVQSFDAAGIASALQARDATRLEGGDAPRHAGVALVLCPLDEEVQLLFIQRAEYPGDPWSGHMAFPGGHQEPSDGGPRAAAEREASEEVGVQLAGARRLGVLDAVYSPAQLENRIGVQPYAYWCDRVPELIPNHEVDVVHWIPIRFLLDPASRTQFVATWENQDYSLPVIGWQDQRIWGMTLRIVDDLVERIRSAFDL
jgi:8-oxo-dGTP pyrophosphatase MutT (NUDIX family)